MPRFFLTLCNRIGYTLRIDERGYQAHHRQLFIEPGKLRADPDVRQPAAILPERRPLPGDKHTPVAVVGLLPEPPDLRRRRVTVDQPGRRPGAHPAPVPGSFDSAGLRRHPDTHRDHRVRKKKLDILRFETIRIMIYIISPYFESMAYEPAANEGQKNSPTDKWKPALICCRC